MPMCGHVSQLLVISASCSEDNAMSSTSSLENKSWRSGRVMFVVRASDRSVRRIDSVHLYFIVIGND
jgi:hypothetical protein